MNSSFVIIAISLVISVLLVNADDGKYRPAKYSDNSGRYIPMNDRAYHHVHDMRELGRYVHIPFPYMGGCGPYDHIPNPYLHNSPPYIQGSDSTEQVSSPTSQSFSYDEYDKKPTVPLVYGFPNIPSIQSYPNLPESSPIELENDSIDITSTTTDAASTENDSTTILTGENLNRKKRSLSHSQPSTIEITTTTARPRTSYNNEGHWRIIQQDENKQAKKYDYFFETENKIFAHEAGKVSGKENANEGTSGIGWYQYVGDDGKIYRVEYEAGPQGFVPKGDHIHKSIQQHLKSLKERNLI